MCRSETKLSAIIVLGGLALLGYALSRKPTAQQLAQAQGVEQTQKVTTSGVTQTTYPRTSYYLGNGGSVREISNNILPEDHGRGQAVAGLWQIYRGTYGSIPLGQAKGSFNGNPANIVIPEEIHVTPQLEAHLAKSVQHRTWETSGAYPPKRTFINY